MALLSVDNLKTYFHTREGVVRAVDGISYDIDAGQTLGIVGESGSGKSVSCYSLLGLIPTPPGRIEGGTALFEGRDLLKCSSKDYRRIRGKEIGMVFQDPMTALNPYMTIGKQLMEPLRVHTAASKREAYERAVTALEAVGITDATRHMGEFPHQFSGGMRQRVMIAMALITRPKLLIADEPTTALDVTVQAQILALINERQKDLGMAVVIITHDMGVIAGTCDEVLVMYGGRVVEQAPKRELFSHPRHPYTQALLASMPSTHKSRDDLYTIPGLPPDLSKLPEGCAFAPRCSHAEEACRKKEMTLAEVSPRHRISCDRVLQGEL